MRLARVTLTAVLLPALLVAVAAPAAASAPTPATPTFGAAIEGYAPYAKEDTCDPTEKPGAQRVRDLLLQTYGPAWTNIVRSCTSASSGHEEGRAVDWGRDVDKADQRQQVEAFLGWLLATDSHGNAHAMARRLGVMYVMWDGRIWGSWNKTWQLQSTGSCDSATSNKTTCHRDHVHISLGWDGAWARTSFYTASAQPCLSGTACPVSRLAGADRYATSVAIGQAAAPSGDTVVIANGQNASLVDGLVSGPLAHKLQAPVLLVPSTGVPAVVADELRRRSARTAVLVGGEGVLGQGVVDGLRAAGIVTLDRVSGADRYATAAAVAARVGGTSAVVASGRDGSLVDALGAGGAAARLGMPILLTAPDSLPAPTREALVGRRSSVVAGGEGVVSSAVMSQLPSPVRVAGSNRYATSAALASHFSGAVGPASVVLASGADANLVDALPGAALGRLTLLTAPTALPTVTRDFVSSGQVQRATALGGPGAVSDDVLRTVSGILGG